MTSIAHYCAKYAIQNAKIRSRVVALITYNHVSATKVVSIIDNKKLIVINNDRLRLGYVNLKYVEPYLNPTSQ